MKTHYDVLGLDKQAPATLVRSQYRRLVKHCHPDLNPGNSKATQQFREVQAAYEVLSDPEKRRLYDQSLNPSYTGKTYTYRSADARYRPHNHTTYSRPVSRPHQPRSFYSAYTVELNLAELFKGTRRPLVVGQTFTCKSCRGAGRLEDENSCERCGGYGFVVSYQRVEVLIPPGLHPGMRLRIELDNGQPEHPLLSAPIKTNVAVTLKLSDPSPFEYRDNQLFIKTQVPAQILANGGEWVIPAPEGGEIGFKIAPQTASGTIVNLRKRGLRNGASHRRGNLLCTVVAKEGNV